MRSIAKDSLVNIDFIFEKKENGNLQVSRIGVPAINLSCFEMWSIYSVVSFCAVGIPSWLVFP